MINSYYFELKLNIFVLFQAQNIVKRAQRFTQRNLLPNHILCYHVRVLEEYAKRLISPIEILPDMELVHHELDESHIKKDNCVCHRLEVKFKNPISKFIFVFYFRISNMSNCDIVIFFLPI